MTRCYIIPLYQSSGGDLTEESSAQLVCFVRNEPPTLEGGMTLRRSFVWLLALALLVQGVVVQAHMHAWRVDAGAAIAAGDAPTKMPAAPVGEDHTCLSCAFAAGSSFPPPETPPLSIPTFQIAFYRVAVESDVVPRPWTALAQPRAPPFS